MTGTTALLHLIGFLTGAVLYAMLLAMVTRRSPIDRLALATAVLGCTWNLGELAARGLAGAGFVQAAAWVDAACYSALGFLGAVVVHAVARYAMDAGSRVAVWAQRPVATTAYGCAAVATLMHVSAAVSGGTLPSSAGLNVMTSAVVCLALPLAVMTGRQANARRALWMAALAVFAVSALHLGRFHGNDESWGAELVGHHASIPLAFAILYQDYRFALADLFLKQALTLLALVLIASGAYSAVQPLAGSPAGVGAMLGLWIGTALVFPWLRRGVGWFVDRVVLERANYAALLERLESELQQTDRVDAVLDRASALLAPALAASEVSWESDSSPLEPHDIAIVTADDPTYVLKVGPLTGGRKLLSDDLTMLERAAVVVARRIDALRLQGERYEQVLREREMRALTTEAELRALRAQTNPHFLFNALTTIGYLIQSTPSRALETLLQLTTLLRGALRSEGEFTTLGRELELIDCYLRIEMARFEERLSVAIDVPADLRAAAIPSLLVQPLVENAIKHGIAAVRDGGRIEIRASRSAEAGACLRVTVRNTGAPLEVGGSVRGLGIGLRSVVDRLRNYYDGHAAFTLYRDADGATVAQLTIPMESDIGADVAVGVRNTAV
jgi:hypothetical protein